MLWRLRYSEKDGVLFLRGFDLWSALKLNGCAIILVLASCWLGIFPALIFASEVMGAVLVVSLCFTFHIESGHDYVSVTRKIIGISLGEVIIDRAALNAELDEFDQWCVVGSAGIVGGPGSASEILRVVYRRQVLDVGEG